MDDLLLTLTVPAVVVASGVYAFCDCRRQRRRPPPPYTRRAARLAARDVLVRAEAVVDSAYAGLGRLYADPAGPRPPGLHRTGSAPAVSGRPDASPDRGPSRPAPARKR